MFLSKPPRLAVGSTGLISDAGGIRVTLLDERIEIVEVDWLYQMMGEANVVTPADILFHSKPSQRNSEKRTATMETRHEVNATPIGQANVADQDIKLAVGCEFESGSKLISWIYLIIALTQEHGKRSIGVLVIFD